MRQIGRATTALALRWPVASVFVIVTVIAGFGLVAYSTTDYSHVTEASLGIRPTMAPEPPDASGAPAAAPSDGPIADFVLTDEEGRRVSLGQQAGKVVLVNFVTSRCADACLRVTHELLALQKTLGDRMGRDVVFLSIALDPRVDSRGAMRNFATGLGVEFNGWRFLTGTPPELDAAHRAFGVQRLDAPPGHDSALDFVHTAAVFLVDGAGVLRRTIEPGLLAPTGLQEVEAAMAGRPTT